MNPQKNRPGNGFTLIELIVVMIIMSVMLVFAAPRFSGFIFPDNTHEFIRWFVGQARNLRNRSVQQQKDFTLNIDMDNKKIWVTDETMESEEALQKAVEKGLTLPDSVQILDVEYPGRGRLLQGTVEIRFYKKGYTDQVILHVGDDNERKVTLLLQAFLPKVEWVEEYVDTF